MFTIYININIHMKLYIKFMCVVFVSLVGEFDSESFLGFTVFCVCFVFLMRIVGLTEGL